MLAGVVVVTVGVVVDTTSLHSKSEHGQPPLQFFYLQKYINDIQDYNGLSHLRFTLIEMS